MPLLPVSSHHLLPSIYSISGIDMFHLTHEIEASDMSSLEAVMSVDEERAKLEKEADLLNNLMTEEVSDAIIMSSHVYMDHQSLKRSVSVFRFIYRVLILVMITKTLWIVFNKSMNVWRRWMLLLLKSVHLLFFLVLVLLRL